MFTRRLQRFGVLLAMMAVSAYLWGCSNLAPTGVPMDESLQPTAGSAPTGESTDGDTNTWW